MISKIWKILGLQPQISKVFLKVGQNNFGNKIPFFFNDKSRNSKRYPFANVKSFWHLMWKMFCHSGGVNSIKTNLLTCNLWTGQYVSYKSVNLFWLNLPHQNGKTFFTSNVKTFSHLQMDIFCYFDFCHCRSNAFWREVLSFCVQVFIDFQQPLIARRYVQTPVR